MITENQDNNKLHCGMCNSAEMLETDTVRDIEQRIVFVVAGYIPSPTVKKIER